MSPEGLLGIVGCVLFEDEIADVLKKDDDLQAVYVIDNEDAEGVMQKIRNKRPDVAVDSVTVERIGDIPAGDYSVLVWMKPMALHQKPDKLREDVLETLRLLADRCDAVLLFYGLCGNAFKKLSEVEGSVSIPVVILRDANGEVVDDCIGTVLGGTDEYLRQLKVNKGAFFLTPMWASNWREMLHKVQIMPSPDDIRGAQYVFEAVGYDKVVKIDTRLGDPGEFESNVNEFASIFNFEKRELDGDLSIVQENYIKAKCSLPQQSDRVGK